MYRSLLSALCCLAGLGWAAGATAVDERCSADLVCVQVVRGEAIELLLDVRTSKPLSFALFLSENLAHLDPGTLQLDGPGTRKLVSFPRPADRWGFFFRVHYGHEAHVHDDGAVYLLPFAVGEAYRVSQASDGLTNHGEENRHAIDWDMPVGTPIHAARQGVVVSVYGNAASSSISGEAEANHIWIRHADGTIAKYLHLDEGGVLVAEGDRVTAGARIGTSGNTGYSSGAHLHFSVSSLGGERLYTTFPARFATAAGVRTLRTDERVRRIH